MANINNKKEQIDQIIKELREKLTLDGRKKVFEDLGELKSEHLIDKSEPEKFTELHLVEKVFELLNLKIECRGKEYSTTDSRRSVDYQISNNKNKKILVEVKPIGVDLFDKDPKQGCVEQIKRIFRMGDVREENTCGVATDGLNWVFVDNKGELLKQGKVLNIENEEDFETIRDYLVGEEEVSSQNVEEISKEFYEKYNSFLHGGKGVSEKDCLVGSIFDAEEEDKEQIAQAIINRLIFIKFLQSKSIIEKDTLNKISEEQDSTLTPLLKQLFFSVLNKPQEERFNVREYYKKIPYLNGSLFTYIPAEDRNPTYDIKAETIRDLIKFLDSFAFTHKEAETRKQVIDPEILGYIFERAMNSTDRKGTGAYYTPKTITKYISENTIYPCILDKVNGMLRKEKVENFRPLEEIDQIYHQSTFFNKIENVVYNLKICDNACGSGAFLLASAKVLFKIYKKLDDATRKSNSDYGLKKLILMNNLYGVDLNPNAVEIAKLRLWLWLVDSYELDHPEPLPNIEYNLRVGNSLIGFDYKYISDRANLKLNLPDHLRDETAIFVLLKKRRDILEKYKGGGEQVKKLKEDLKKIDEIIITQLTTEAMYQDFYTKKITTTKKEVKNLKPFHWGFEFYDVMEKGGFDVIVGNPPYVRQELIKEQKKFYEKLYPKVYVGSADLSVYFVKKSIDLLKQGGYHSYIITNKWLRAKYGENLRNYLTDNVEIDEIIDFNGVKVFVGATVDVMIYILKNKPFKDNTLRYCDFKNSPVQDINDIENIQDYVDKNSFEIEQKALKQGWDFYQDNILEIKRKIEEVGKPLKEWDVKIYYGIKTGFNEAFIVDTVTKNRILAECKTEEERKRTEEIIKPILRGRDIGRYSYEWKGLWIILAKYGSFKDIEEKYSAVFNHLKKYETQLKNRGQCRYSRGGKVGGQHHWLELDNNPKDNYLSEFDKPKIVWQRVTKKPSFIIGADEFFIHDSLAFFTSKEVNLKYLGAILNSKLIHFYFDMIGHLYSDSGYLLSNQYLERFPIPETPEPQQKPFIELADKMLSLNKKLKETTDEKEKSKIKKELETTDERIDEMVYELYELSEEEVEVVEGGLK